MLQAHLLTPVSAEMTRRLEHEGQNNVAMSAQGDETNGRAVDRGTGQNEVPLWPFPGA